MSDEYGEGTQRIVINRCHGGFGLSRSAVEWMREKSDEIEDMTTLPGEYYPDGSGPRDFRPGDSFGRDIPRDNTVLVDCVQSLEEDASGDYADLKIVEIPADVDWEIKEYDGAEWVAETHRTWS